MGIGVGGGKGATATVEPEKMPLLLRPPVVQAGLSGISDRHAQPPLGLGTLEPYSGAFCVQFG